jgi:WD40 repeat protein
VDPESYDDEDEVSGGNAGGSGEGVTLFSASSDRTIRRWNISTSSAAEIPNSDPIIAHETSVDAIHFDASGDLWTASADKTAKCLSRSRNWEADTTLEHADYVRDVAIDEVGGWVITACRDEGVRVWERGSGRLKHVFEGHWEEVTGLCVVGGQRVVSVSIDGTVRVWGLKAAELEKAIKEAQEEKDGVEKDAEVKESLLTEEEERELAELLGDSD